MNKKRRSHPRKGTNLRKLVLLLIRPEGVSGPEAYELGLVTHPYKISSKIIELETNYDYVIKPMSRELSNAIKPTPGRRTLRYRLTTIFRPNGTFREI